MKTNIHTPHIKTTINMGAHAAADARHHCVVDCLDGVLFLAVVESCVLVVSDY